MTEVVEAAVSELLTEVSESTTVIEGNDVQVIDVAGVTTAVETTSDSVVVESSPAVTTILDTAPTEVVTDTQLHTLVVSEIDTYLIDVAGQGPPGPPGSAASSYPGKTFVWSQGILQEVRLYADAAKTQLAERRVLTYTGDVLTSIAFYSGDGTLTKTRTLAYTSGVLTSVTEV